MVVVEDASGPLYAQVVGGAFVPRQVHHGLQIGELNAVFRALGVEEVEFVEFLLEGLCHLVVPFLLGSLLLEFLALGRALAVAEFLLDVLDLLLQEVLSLLFIDVVACLRADVLLELEQLHLLVKAFQGLDDTVLERVALEEVDFVGDAEGERGADVVDGQHVVLDVVDGEVGLVGHLFVGIDILRGSVLQVGQSCVVFFVRIVGQHFSGEHAFAHQEGFGLRDVDEGASAEGLHDGGDIVAGAGYFKHPHQSCKDSGVIEVVEGGVVGIGTLLAHHGKDGALGILQLVNQIAARFPTDKYRSNDAGEEHHVACGQYGTIAVNLDVEQL